MGTVRSFIIRRLFLWGEVCVCDVGVGFWIVECAVCRALVVVGWFSFESGQYIRVVFLCCVFVSVYAIVEWGFAVVVVVV